MRPGHPSLIRVWNLQLSCQTRRTRTSIAVIIRFKVSDFRVRGRRYTVRPSHTQPEVTKLRVAGYRSGYFDFDLGSDIQVQVELRHRLELDIDLNLKI